MFPDRPTPDHLFPIVPGLDIVGVVARGGHGTVYEARQREHDRIVALKVLDTHLADDETARRFDRERIALGRISDHPAIVSLLDSGRTATGAPYLLLEFATGGSLADRLERGPLDLDAATALVIELAAATERAHDVGVVHRDIKPGNVLRSAYGHWMLTDFGIASLTDRSHTSTVQVSYAHTAPEVFDGGAPTPEGDVYSLASVLATCLTGVEPFAMAPDESTVSVMRRVMTEPYPDIRQAGVPDDLAALLEMALSKDPAQRPISAQTFAMALNEIRATHGLAEVAVRSARASGPEATMTVSEEDLAAVPSWSADAPPTRRRAPRRGVRALVAVACLALLAVGAGSLLPSLTENSGVPQAVARFVAPDTAPPGALATIADDGGGPLADGADADTPADAGDNDGPGGGDNDGQGANDGPGGGDNDGPGGNGRGGRGGNGNGTGGGNGNGGGNGGGGNG